MLCFLTVVVLLTVFCPGVVLALLRWAVLTAIVVAFLLIVL